MGGDRPAAARREGAGDLARTGPDPLDIVDQCEELYTTAGRGDDVARFVALILGLAEAERVHSVLVLRGDFDDEGWYYNL
jgi:conflict system STAND superfamily ATPase